MWPAVSGVEASGSNAVGAAVALRSRRTNGVTENASIVIDGWVGMIVMLIKRAYVSDA